MMIFEGITALGAVLSAITLLTVCKVSTDMMLADEGNFEEAIFVILIGSLLSAVLLFS